MGTSREKVGGAEARKMRTERSSAEKEPLEMYGRMLAREWRNNMKSKGRLQLRWKKRFWEFRGCWNLRKENGFASDQRSNW